MEGGLHNLNEWNPVKRPILVLCVVEFLLEHAVSWLSPEVRKRIENSQMMLSKYLHMDREFVFNKFLKQFFDLRVCKYVDAAFRNKVLCDPPNLKHDWQVGLLGLEEEARSLHDVRTCS